MRRVSYSLTSPSAAALVVISCFCGCGRSSNEDGTPDVDPAAAAEKAIELYDKDGSGALEENELAATPGILALREEYDADGNQQVSEDEIAARLQSIYRAGTGWLIPSFCRMRWTSLGPYGLVSRLIEIVRTVYFPSRISCMPARICSPSAFTRRVRAGAALLSCSILP